MFNQRFDLIVVGAGTAGLEIAKNASMANLKVCLLDLGVSKGNSIFNKIPLLSGKILSNEKYCYNLLSKKIEALGDRKVPMLQGIGFGGSGLINGNVSYLGFEEKYNNVFDFWPKDFYSKIWKHISDNRQFNYNREIGFYDELTEYFKKNLINLNYKEKQDLDNSEEGVSYLHLNTLKSVRHNFINDFVRNANHENIERVPKVSVEKIILDNGIGSGVLCRSLNSPKDIFTIYGNKIVISAGTLFSPQVLFNSGIGDPVLLQNNGKKVVIGQKHVGKHLKDHANFRIDFVSKGFESISQKSKGIKLIKEIFKYYLNKNSILAGCGSSLGWNKSDFMGKREISNLVRYHLVHFTQKREKLLSSGIEFEVGERASIGCFQVFPKSEGELNFSRKKVPNINPNYLSNHFDKILAVEAYKTGKALLKKIGFDMVCSTVNKNDPLKYLKENTYSGYHLIGTNRMAINKNKGVVDPCFRVFDTSNVFVCDASIFPDFVSTHQYLPTLAIAKMFSSQQKWLKF